MPNRRELFEQYISGIKPGYGQGFAFARTAPGAAAINKVHANMPVLEGQGFRDVATLPDTGPTPESERRAQLLTDYVGRRAEGTQLAPGQREDFIRRTRARPMSRERRAGAVAAEEFALAAPGREAAAAQRLADRRGAAFVQKFGMTQEQKAAADKAAAGLEERRVAVEEEGAVIAGERVVLDDDKLDFERDKLADETRVERERLKRQYPQAGDPGFDATLKAQTDEKIRVAVAEGNQERVSALTDFRVEQALEREREQLRRGRPVPKFEAEGFETPTPEQQALPPALPGPGAPGDTNNNRIPDSDPDDAAYQKFENIVKNGDPETQAAAIKRAKIRMKEIEDKWRGKAAQPQT